MEILEIASNKPGMDVVVNGGIIANVQGSAVMVEDEYDLAELQNYAPGTIAYTAGYKAVWQLNGAKTTWVDLLGSNDIEMPTTDEEEPTTSDDPETSDGLPDVPALDTN